MNEIEVRRAVAAGINDSCKGMMTACYVVACIFLFFLHPLIGTGLLLAWFVLWLVWRGVRAVTNPARERRERQLRADRERQSTDAWARYHEQCRAEWLEARRAELRPCFTEAEIDKLMAERANAN
jgi:ABC-type transport system involved in cytochrome bd biosynthesis fused ATPase/permease subunit